MTHCHPEKFWFVLPGAGYYFFKVPQSFQQGATFENHCPRQNHMHSSWTGPRRGVSLLQLQPVSGQQGDCGGHTPANPPSPRCSSYVRSIPFSGRLDGWKLFAQAQALRLGMSFMYQLIGASAVLACQHLPIRHLWKPSLFSLSSFFCYEAFPHLSLPLSLCSFILICLVFICFHTAYWRCLMGWAPKCIPVITAPEKRKCQSSAFLSQAEVTWRRCTSLVQVLEHL